MSRVMLALKVTVEEGFWTEEEGLCCRVRWCSTRSILELADGRRRAIGRKLKTLSKGQQVLLYYASASDCGVWLHSALFD